MSWRELGTPAQWAKDFLAGVALIAFSVGAFVLAGIIGGTP